jgi:hypothetical protein
MAEGYEIGEVIRRILDQEMERTSRSLPSERRPVGRPPLPKKEKPVPPPPDPYPQWPLLPDDQPESFPGQREKMAALRARKIEELEWIEKRMQIPRPDSTTPPADWEPHP